MASASENGLAFACGNRSISCEKEGGCSDRRMTASMIRLRMPPKRHMTASPVSSSSPFGFYSKGDSAVIRSWKISIANECGSSMLFQVFVICQSRREGPSSYSPIKFFIVLITIPECMSIHTTNALPLSLMRTSQEVRFSRFPKANFCHIGIVLSQVEQLCV